MKVSNIVQVLETLAPPELAAEWDNVGLLVGKAGATANKLLLCIDLTEQVLAEAVAAKAQMVLAYHPVIFKPLPRVTADDSPVVYAAARRGLGVYCMHTGLDAAKGGTNDVLAELLGLVDCRPLEPAAAGERCKIVVFVQAENLSQVSEAAFAAGAGRIGNYFDCSFFAPGTGTFRGGEQTHPTVGLAGRREAIEELRLEFVAPQARAGEVVSAVRAAHTYEEPAIDVYPLAAVPDGCGMGRIGRLKRPATAKALIARIKKATGLKNMLVAAGASGKVTTAACCAGSCGSLFKPAAAGGATFYLTGEMRHHDALAASAAGMTCVCLGHSNSERMVLDDLRRQLKTALAGVRITISKRDRDPFQIV